MSLTVTRKMEVMRRREFGGRPQELLYLSQGQTIADRSYGNVNLLVSLDLFMQSAEDPAAHWAGEASPRP